MAAGGLCCCLTKHDDVVRSTPPSKRWVARRWRRVWMPKVAPSRVARPLKRWCCNAGVLCVACDCECQAAKWDGGGLGLSRSRAHHGLGSNTGSRLAGTATCRLLSMPKPSGYIRRHCFAGCWTCAGATRIGLERKQSLKDWGDAHCNSEDDTTSKRR